MLLNRKTPCVSLVVKILPKKQLRLFLTILLIFLAAICNVVAPIILKKIIDNLTKSPDIKMILGLFTYFALIIFFGRIFFEAKFVVYAKWEQSLITNAFNELYKITQHNIPNFYRNHLAGSITSRIFQSVLGLKVLLFDSLFHMLPLCVEFVLILVTVALVFNKQMMLIIGIGTLLYSICLILLNNKLLQYQNEIRNSTIESQGMATDLLNSWKDIKLTNGYKSSNRIFKKFTTSMAEKNLLFYEKRSIFGFLQSLPLTTLFIYANYQAIMDYVNGLSTIGSLLLINSYLWQLVRPLETFGLLFRSISRSYTDFISANLILSDKQEDVRDEYSLPSMDLLSIANLYDDVILKNINLTICKGDKIAVIGESGAGKTTLLNIMSALENNYTGSIFYNKINFKDIPVDQLRRKIALLASDSKIITGTIRENLLLGDYANVESINEALAYACIEDKVKSLPDGIDTEINDGTQILSAGEKQRIKLARMFMLNSEIQIFDEATSAMDLILENKIIDNILSKKNSTIIFITHRLSHLSKFNKILFLKKGRIVESGAHEQLLKLKGGYFEIWNNQSQLNS